MLGQTVFEFDKIVDGGNADKIPSNTVPADVFEWLESLCLGNENRAGASWLKLTKLGNQRAIQVTDHVGVLRSPGGFQLEILPKIGKNTSADIARARLMLIDMLRCLNGFRHLKTDSANLQSEEMPLLEVFVGEFLQAVEAVVKRGLRSDYVTRQDNLFALRGKLLVSQNLRHNLFRPDRFYTEHDEFSPDRPENRLLHAALRGALSIARTPANQRLARELCFIFADIPESTAVHLDFQRIRLDRGMNYYEAALDWARLILKGLSPLTGSGDAEAPSLLFPMEKVFEAYVAKHLANQLQSHYQLKIQVRNKHLVEHQRSPWFSLKPDLLILENSQNKLLLDTKWKLLNSSATSDRYQLSQSDFYQLYAYGHHYLGGQGDMVLIYPKTDTFNDPLPVFDFPQTPTLKLWVLPFCLEGRQLLLSDCQTAKFFQTIGCKKSCQSPSSCCSSYQSVIQNNPTHPVAIAP